MLAVLGLCCSSRAVLSGDSSLAVVHGLSTTAALLVVENRLWGAWARQL